MVAVKGGLDAPGGFHWYGALGEIEQAGLATANQPVNVCNHGQAGFKRLNVLRRLQQLHFLFTLAVKDKSFLQNRYGVLTSPIGIASILRGEPL